MKRRQFIKSAVAVAVGVALPLSGRAYRSHEWSVESEMCLVCRMTRQMIEETGPAAIECPGTAIYDYRHVTYRTEWILPKSAKVSQRYAEMLAYSMQQTKEVVAANVFHRGFGL